VAQVAIHLFQVLLFSWRVVVQAKEVAVLQAVLH
jgi:hypothetical protein